MYIYYPSLLVLKAANASGSTNHLQVVWEQKEVVAPPSQDKAVHCRHTQEAFHAAVHSTTP